MRTCQDGDKAGRVVSVMKSDLGEERRLCLQLGVQERPGLGVKPWMICRGQVCDFGRSKFS